jgi:acetyl-CoA carboxylase/biotin carboxylase 1
MFRQALIKIWKTYYTNLSLNQKYSKDATEERSDSPSNQTAHEKNKQEFNNLMQSNFFTCVELVIDRATENLVEKNRIPGENDIGMVAWKMTLMTPEYPNGRELIVIANDITFKIGSFGMEEDLLFKKASELARKLGIPRIYISANSGARIGLAEELKQLFKIAWLDPSIPDKGFKYIYLTPTDYEKIKKFETNGPIVKVEELKDEETNETRFKIIDIVGKENGIGVENLRGSGMIAGETSTAYNEICTISLVTCRAVGIGAYLVRLGQRVVQVENSHIILTGAGALNKVLGREVYTSNNQLGGIQIMHNNGITHGVVGDDFEGVSLILRWVSFMPGKVVKGNPMSLAILEPIVDSIDRLVDFLPTKAAYDPRWMIEGKLNNSTSNEPNWISGFFDRDSFHEVMGAWAKTVVCGRARLGGIPLGVIAVETRSVEVQVPADPANLDSDAKSIQQAGQVWFPDSAYKTSQAIKDFAREHLPLMIFANWRGFSGGMKDMYEQVIKFGAYIVDGLREYKKPVIIYIPPNGELRGGAWVVVDPTINERYMEMYADNESRGGVLEPEGTVEIKYRTKDLLKTMHRIDPICRELKDKIKTLKESIESEKKQELEDDQNENSGSKVNKKVNDDLKAQIDSVKEKIKEHEKEIDTREKYLIPIYHQVSVTFADLHDTPGRMLRKGVIKDIVDWKKSRKFFYWRFRRLLAQDEIVQKIIDCSDNEYTFQSALALLKSWFEEAYLSNSGNLSKRNKFQNEWEKNESVALWIESQNANDSFIKEKLNELRNKKLVNQLKLIVGEHPNIAMETLSDIVHMISIEQSRQFVDLLNKRISEESEKYEESASPITQEIKKTSTPNTNQK